MSKTPSSARLRIAFTRQAAQALRALDERSQQLVVSATERLSEDPRSMTALMHRFGGPEEVYRLRLGSLDLDFVLVDESQDIVVVRIEKRK